MDQNNGNKEASSSNASDPNREQTTAPEVSNPPTGAPTNQPVEPANNPVDPAADPPGPAIEQFQDPPVIISERTGRPKVGHGGRRAGAGRPRGRRGRRRWRMLFGAGVRGRGALNRFRNLAPHPPDQYQGGRGRGRGNGGPAAPPAPEDPSRNIFDSE